MVLGLSETDMYTVYRVVFEVDGVDELKKIILLK